MKKRLFPSLFLLLLLTACQTEGISSTDSVTEDGEIAFENLLVEMLDDNHYQISFHLTAGDKGPYLFYFSSDTHYDNSDISAPFRVEAGDNNYSLDYTDFLNDFYLLCTNTYGEVIAKENVVLPAFTMSITPGTDEKTGLDILSFDYFPNGYTASNYFDTDGITIYRASSSDFSEAEAVIENVTISDSFSVPSSESEPYYWFTSYFGDSEGYYISQPFKRSTTYGEDLVEVTDISFTEKNGESVLLITGKKTTTGTLNLRTVLADGNNTPIYSDCTFTGDVFTSTISLSKLPSQSNPYEVYLSFAAGVNMRLSYDLLSEAAKEKKLVDGDVCSFYNDEGKLSLFKKEKAAVNVTETKLIEKDGKPIFSTKGNYDESLFPATPSLGPSYNYTSACLVFAADGNAETVSYPLTLEDGTFSAEADLSQLTKLGPWYSIYLYFPTSDSLTETYTSRALYAYEKSDANDLSQSIDIDSTFLRYRFQTYSDNLKIEVKNYSATVSGFRFVMKDSHVNLELTGKILKGSSYFKVSSGSGHSTDIHTADVTPNEDGSFVCDIDINDIASYTNYHIDWIGDAIGDIEMSSEYFEKPHTVISSEDGYIFSVKTETLQSTSYFKVYKDRDAAKVSGLDFLLETDGPKAAVSGYLNSEQKANAENLYLQLRALSFSGSRVVYDEEAVYAPLEAEEDYSFRSTLDLSSMVKGKRYQIKMMAKDGENYKDISAPTIAYTGFYTEYLSLDYGNNALTTKDGTYHIRNFGGENDHYEIYLALD